MISASEKRNELSLEFPAWKARTERNLSQKPLEWLRQFKADSDITPKVKLISARFNSLSMWYAANYAASGIGAMPNQDFLALSTRAGISGFLFQIPIYDFHPGNLGYYRIDEHGLLLSQTITTGWKDHAELVARHGFKELNRLMDRGITVRRMPWFMLELAKDWLKADVSLDSEFRTHEIENLGIWEKLLGGWRDRNSERFDALISEMAEYHLSQSQDPKGEDDWFEFEDHALWLFPIELLAILRLREWEGIPNPPLSHPIFSATPLAKLYPPPAWPKDEVLDQAEAKFRAAYPNTPSVADLPALRKEQGGI